MKEQINKPKSQTNEAKREATNKERNYSNDDGNSELNKEWVKEDKSMWSRKRWLKKGSGQDVLPWATVCVLSDNEILVHTRPRIAQSCVHRDSLSSWVKHSPEFEFVHVPSDSPQHHETFEWCDYCGSSRTSRRWDLFFLTLAESPFDF